MTWITMRGLAAIICLPVTGCFLYWSVGRLLKIRDSVPRKLLLLLCCGIVVMMPIYFADWGNILPTLCAFLAVVWLTCEGSGWKRISLGFLLANTIFAFSVIVDNWVRDYGNFQTYNIVLLERCLFSAVLCAVLRRFGPGKRFDLSPAMWKLLLLLTITPVGIVFSLVLLSSYETRRGTMQFFVLLLLALFSFVGILWTALVLARQQRLEQETMTAQMNQKYYKAVEQQNFEIRKLRHDMVNHLQTLSALPEGQKEEYIRELLETPGFSRVLKYCGDDTVNAVLSSKEPLMKKYGIDFDVRAGIKEQLPLEKPDICAVFGNALDNAIEAVCQLPEGGRSISMETCLAKGMLVLRVENSCGNAEADRKKKKPGLFITTKKDKEAHGFGLRSIGEAVEKYGGHMEIRQEDGRFVLFAYCRV